MDSMTENEIDELFDKPPDPRTVAVALTREQTARMDAVKSSSYLEQEVVYQAIIKEVQPELARLRRMKEQEL